MKNEAAGKNIVEFVGLRPKLYSLKMKGGKESKRCKGVTKSVVKKEITHEDYRNCFFSGKEVLKKMNVIRSREHEIFSETVEKVALSSSLKMTRYLILEDEMETLAWGHWRIKK